MDLRDFFPTIGGARIQTFFRTVGYPETGTRQNRLRMVAAAYRAMALHHPGVFMYFSSFRLNSRSGLSFLERILQIYEAAGLHVEDRARHFRILGHYLVDACLNEVVKGPSAAFRPPMKEIHATVKKKRT